MLPSAIAPSINHPDVQLALDIDLTAMCTLRLKSRGALATVTSIEGLKYLVQLLSANSVPYQVIGWGANTLLREEMHEQLLIKLDLSFVPEKIFSEVKAFYQLPASAGLNQLIKFAKLLGLKGWEVLTGIPASLGGAIFMNAGTKYGDISSIVESVQVLGLDGAVKTLRTKENPEHYFTYRKNLFLRAGEIIIGATLYHYGVDVSGVNQKIDEYLEYRKRTQPLATKNCGCVFKNPLPEQAGKLIDELGLKGVEMGGLRISPVHANFIENRGGATYTDFLKLVEFIQNEVYQKKGIKLELEVQDFIGKS